MSQWKNQFNTTTFQFFMEKFFDDSFLFMSNAGAKIFNKKLIIPMDNDRNAEIILSTHNVIGEYVGFRVKIIHKTNGEISKQWFGFKEYLSHGFENKKFPYIIEHCATDWYMDGATPESITSLIEQIDDYIKMYN